MNIVIVGGGFAGVKAALELAKRQAGNITLISDEDYFLHHATLYATATGRSTAESVVPLVEIFHDYPSVKIVKDAIAHFDPQKKTVTGARGTYAYDTLILALGSVTTFFGINGMAKHAYGIKSLEEIRLFSDHIHKQVADGEIDKEYFVIGAGPTGVELAGALQEYLKELTSLHRIKKAKVKITLVEAADRILPRSSKTAAKKVTKYLKRIGIGVHIKHKVEALSDDAITIDGKEYDTQTAVWTSGVANNPFFATHAQHFNLAPNGRVNVDPYLLARKDVYVLGDSNTVRFSGMAWPALQQATFVAKHIARLRAKRAPKAFKPRSVPSGLPVGEKWGYVEWKGIYAAGKTGYCLRRLMELYGYTRLVPFKKALVLWRAHTVPHIEV